MTVTITGPVEDVTGIADNTSWQFASVLRFTEDGTLVTAKPKVVYPVAGILTVKLKPGPTIVTYGKQAWNVTVPDTDGTLKELIEEGIAFPPQTAQEALDAAVAQYVETNRNQFKTRAVPITSGPDAGKAQWVDANDDPVGDPVTWDQVIGEAVAEAAATAAATTVTPGIAADYWENLAPQPIAGDTPGTARIQAGGVAGPEFAAAIGLVDGLADAGTAGKDVVKAATAFAVRAAGGIPQNVTATVDPRDPAFGAKGDKSQDDQPAIAAAIAALKARLSAVGGGVGVVDLGHGVYGLGSKLVVPSYIKLRGRINGYAGNMTAGAQLQPLDGFDDDYLVEAESGSTCAGLEDVRIYMNNAFLGDAVHWQGLGATISRVRIEHAYGTALKWDVQAGVLEHSVISGFYPRSSGTDVKSLAAPAGVLHIGETSRDNMYFNNEIDGGAAYTATPYSIRNSSLYHCAVYSEGGGIDRWFGNIFENGDIGFHGDGLFKNLFVGNRFEFNVGHGGYFGGGSTSNNFVGDSYNDNGFGQDDTFFDLYMVTGANGRNSFTGLRFGRESTGTAESINSNRTAACVFDCQQANADNGYTNQYANCIEDGYWRSSPFVTLLDPSPSNAIRSNIREGFPRQSMFASAPTSGNFAYGDTYRIGGTPVAGGGYGYIFQYGCTLGTLTGLTGSITSGSNILTVNDATKHVIGAKIAISGAWASQPYAVVLGRQVGAPNNLILSRAATSTVSDVSITYVNVNPLRWGAIDLSGSASVNPASIAAGSDEGTTRTVTVSGAALGDRVDATFSLDLQGVELRAWVSAANTVSYRFFNPTGGAVDLASGTVKVWVRK